MLAGIKDIINKLFKANKGQEKAIAADEPEEEGVTANNSVLGKQLKLVVVILMALLLAIGLVVGVMKEKTKEAQKITNPEVLKIDLPDKALDMEKHYRQKIEEDIEATNTKFKEQLEQVEQKYTQAFVDAEQKLREEINNTRQQLEIARQELSSANQQLTDLTREERERLDRKQMHYEGGRLEQMEFDSEIEFDMPKSLKDYIPQGTYFVGRLAEGVRIATSVNSGEEQKIPVTIELTDRGNLSKEHKIKDIRKCHIAGEAKGNISTESVEIRLTRLICMEDGMVISSKIAGKIHGPDGFNGIKGTVVMPSNKHVKNAMVGGMISGLASSAKGQEGINVTGAGIISTPRKGAKDMITQGALTGTSNAAEKVAEYYLRLAESMSPVLQVPGGVRVNPRIEEGFFYGEVSTHARIRAERDAAKQKTNTSDNKGQDSKENVNGYVYDN